MRMTVFLCLLMALVAPLAAPATAAEAPKNVIVLIADGCGFNHVDAASLYQFGVTGRQVYERFPVRLGMSTYSVGGSYDAQAAWASFDHVKNGATDSAAAGTVMSTGVKTYNGAVGLDADKKPLKHALTWAKEQGKRTGVVSSVQWTHATPACFVAHNESRGNMEAIGKEMILRSPIDVIMGAGHPAYDNDGRPVDELKHFAQVGGRETWEALQAGTAGGDADGDGVADPWTLIETREQFQALAEGPTPKRVVGVAQVAETLQMRRGGGGAAPFAAPRAQTIPTLAEITRAALNVLHQDGSTGLFLMIEGGAVDWASHENNAARMIEEQIDFNLAVEAAVEWVETYSNWDESLIVVTADHETGYLTGPDSNPGWNPLAPATFGTMPGMQWHSGGHTNSLVPFYAKGRGSELFTRAATKTDPVRGAYLDNTDLGKTLIQLHAGTVTARAE